jgi:molybdenum cofactor guanylyltransferase
VKSISGVILAGGRSSRFGRDKALEVWQEKTLIEHVSMALRCFPEQFIIGGTPGQYGFLHLSVYPDLEPHQGSLYGLARALEFASFPRVAISACDTPNLTRKYWEFMANLEPADVIIPENADGFLEPLAAIYRKRKSLKLIKTALEVGNLKMTGWFEQFIGERAHSEMAHSRAPLRVRVVKWSELEPHFKSNLFLNANTPSDLLG